MTKNPYVILSGENCNAICEVELLRVERSEQAKARCAAPQGYGSEFGWLATENVTSIQKVTEILNHIPLRQNASRFHLVLHSVKVRLRSACTPPFAQNDRLEVCLVVFVSHRQTTLLADRVVVVPTKLRPLIPPRLYKSYLN